MTTGKETSSSTDGPVTVSRSSSSSSIAPSMVSSDLSRASSVSSSTTTSSEPEPGEAPEPPPTDNSHDDDGGSTSTGKWSFTRYRPERLCSPTEPPFSSSAAQEGDKDCYTTYSLDEGAAADAAHAARVQDGLSKARDKAKTARDKLDRLLQLRPLTQTKDFSRHGTDPPAGPAGKPRAEPRHWETLRRFAAAVASETAELRRCEGEVAHLIAELALLRLDLGPRARARPGR